MLEAGVPQPSKMQMAKTDLVHVRIIIVSKNNFANTTTLNDVSSTNDANKKSGYGEQIVASGYFVGKPDEAATRDRYAIRVDAICSTIVFVYFSKNKMRQLPIRLGLHTHAAYFYALKASSLMASQP